MKIHLSAKADRFLFKGLKDSKKKKIFGTIVPVISKRSLINYKKEIDRKIDKQDIIEIINKSKK